MKRGCSILDTVNPKRRELTIEFLILLIEILFLVLSCSLRWATENYGNIGLDEIIFQLSMPLAGTATHIFESYAKCLIPIPIIILAQQAIYLMITFIRKKSNRIAQIATKVKKFARKCAPIVFCIWMVMIVFTVNDEFGLFGWVKARLTESTFIEEQYVNPQDVSIEFPDEKRNLICIFVESAETTNQDVANGGIFDENYIVEMTNLAKNNVSFSQSDKIEGAAVSPASGWTIAALVSETSGMPLKLLKYDDAYMDNSMGKYEYFLPGATTLGDILEKEGYKNYFMAGSNFNFGGRTNYFKSHGNYEIFDYYTAIKEEKIDKDYKVWWGFEDQKLYSYAKEKILELAASDQPFNFSIITVDTHHENGYKCNICEDIYDNQYANVWRCASKQLDEFVKWIQAQDFYDNTTIVIVGDHCSMDSDFYDELKYDKHHGTTERKVYNCFINSAVEPINEKNRKFTTLDIFPTILASLGATVEGDRLGLGTNLFTDTETLAEEYGYDELFAELDCKSSFYNNELLYH
jgi:phosphoglycerol transferase